MSAGTHISVLHIPQEITPETQEARAVALNSMTPNTRKSLDSVVSDLNRWLLKHKSVYIAGIRDRIISVLEEENSPVNGTISPCERVSYEKCLDRIDERLQYIKGQANHDAFGAHYTMDQSKEIKDLKASRKEILTKLGLPL
jgi:hypothetical protein